MSTQKVIAICSTVVVCLAIVVGVVAEQMNHASDNRTDQFISCVNAGNAPAECNLSMG